MCVTPAEPPTPSSSLGRVGWPLTGRPVSHGGPSMVKPSDKHRLIVSSILSGTNESRPLRGLRTQMPGTSPAGGVVGPLRELSCPGCGTRGRCSCSGSCCSSGCCGDSDSCCSVLLLGILHLANVGRRYDRLDRVAAIDVRHVPPAGLRWPLIPGQRPDDMRRAPRARHLVEHMHRPRLLLVHRCPFHSCPDA